MLRLTLAGCAIAVFSFVVAIWLDRTIVMPDQSAPTAAPLAENELQGLQKGEEVMQGAMPHALKPGTLAPPLPLLRADGSGKVELKELQAQKPVVLIFGSFTCDCFYKQVAHLDLVHEQYKDRADFYFIYVPEAHPDNEVTVKLDQRQARMYFPRLKSVAECMERAQLLGRSTGMRMPAFVPLLDEKLLQQSYAPCPARFMVIDRTHHIVFNAGLVRIRKYGVTHTMMNTSGFERFLCNYLSPGAWPVAGRSADVSCEAS
jgi:hypothetical protein